MMARIIALALLVLVLGTPVYAQQRFTQVPVKLQSAAGADGNGSAVTTKGYLSIALQITGTFTATVNFEGTTDGATWVALKCGNMATDTRVTTVTSAALVQCNVQGLSSFRARISGYSAGSVTVQGYLMDAVLGSTSGGGTATLSGSVTPANNFANPTDAITVFSLNGCYDGATWDLCVKGTAGAGTVDSGTARTAEATDSQLSTDIAAIKTAVQLIDDDQTGASLNHHVSVGTTEDETEIKATAGRLLSIQITNSAATVAYFRCANLTAANTTPGTSTVFYGLAVPGATTGAGITANFGPTGIAFSTALTCWVVTGKAESDVAEVGANDVQWNVQYK